MYYFYILGRVLTFIFPRNFCYLIAKSFSIIQFYSSKKDREAVIHNLSVIFKGEDKIKRYAKETFINFSYYLVDFFRYSKLTNDFIKKYVKIQGLENLNQAFSKGKGIISVTAHLGNYELAGAVMCFLGYPVSAVALPHKDKRINRFFDNQRKRVGVKVIPTGGAVKRCFTALRNKEIVALLGDKSFTDAGWKGKLFSKNAINIRGGATTVLFKV